MIANNPGGVLNPLITSTTVALASLDATLTNETGKLGTQKAMTQAKQTFRAALDSDIAKVHGDFVASYGRDSVEVTDAFPEGRNIFNTCDDSALENKLQALAGKVNTYAALLKPSTVSLTGSLVSIWIALYAAAATGRANFTASADARRAALRVLKLQLFKNLLELAGLFPNDEEKAMLYCPQQYLEDPQQPTPPPVPPTP